MTIVRGLVDEAAPLDVRQLGWAGRRVDAAQEAPVALGQVAAQDQDAGLKAKFAPLAKALTEGEAAIIGELNGAQGKPVDIGGYYHPDLAKAGPAMRPSATSSGTRTWRSPSCRCCRSSGSTP